MEGLNCKMEMSLDDIILLEQKKKGILRTSTKDIKGNFLNLDEEILSQNDIILDQDKEILERPMVTMNSTNFIPHYYPKRVAGLSQRQWLQYKHRNGYRRQGQVHKQLPSGIPLINIKRGFRQGILGNDNYNVKHWRGHGNPRYQSIRYSGKSYPLTSKYLDQFNEQNVNYIPRGGPGSMRSRGSQCSNCSRASSARSKTSYRSVHSNRSSRSRQTNSYSSQKPNYKGAFYRFKCYLNKRIQQHIHHIQNKKALRLQNSSRGNLIDEPAKCQPQPRETRCTLNYRFRRFIVNPIN